MQREQDGQQLPLIGAVLAGGQSRRLGRDKALVEWNGIPLAGQVGAVVAQVVSPVVIIGAPGRSYERLGFPVVTDPADLAGRGPLAGLLSALRLRCGDVLLVACDTPLIDAPFLHRLVGAAQGTLATAVELEGRLHPMPGVYRAALVPAIQHLLARGPAARLQDVFSLPGTRRLAAGQLGEAAAIRRQLNNVNTMNDLQRLPGSDG